MVTEAFAKINITLDVTGKREDGYHLLEMIMQSVDIRDVIHIEKHPEIVLTTDRYYIPTDRRNTVYKACELFSEASGIKGGAKIHIEKKIPVAAGMAGGSSDAGAVLKALNTLYGNPFTEKELLELGLKLGADVPFTMKGGTYLCTGVGEIMEKLPDFSGYTVVTAKPSFGVSTREVFSRYSTERVFRHPDTRKVIEYMEEGNLKGVSENMKNLLENVTIPSHPIIKTIKNTMVKKGALGSLMTGSGSSVFGFFDDDVKALEAYSYFKNLYPEVFLTKTVNPEREGR